MLRPRFHRASLASLTLMLVATFAILGFIPSATSAVQCKVGVQYGDMSRDRDYIFVPVRITNQSSDPILGGQFSCIAVDETGQTVAVGWGAYGDMPPGDIQHAMAVLIGNRKGRDVSCRISPRAFLGNGIVGGDCGGGNVSPVNEITATVSDITHRRRSARARVRVRNVSAYEAGELSVWCLAIGSDSWPIGVSGTATFSKLPAGAEQVREVSFRSDTRGAESYECNATALFWRHFTE